MIIVCLQVIVYFFSCSTVNLLYNDVSLYWSARVIAKLRPLRFGQLFQKKSQLRIYVFES